MVSGNEMNKKAEAGCANYFVREEDRAVTCGDSKVKVL